MAKSDVRATPSGEKKQDVQEGPCEGHRNPAWSYHTKAVKQGQKLQPGVKFCECKTSRQINFALLSHCHQTFKEAFPAHLT